MSGSKEKVDSTLVKDAIEKDAIEKDDKKKKEENEITNETTNESLLNVGTRMKEKEEINEEDNFTSCKNKKEEKLLKKNKKNTTVSTFSPAYISDPIYEWEVSSYDRVFYDAVNDFVIHQNASTKALLVTDIKKVEENYNGVYVKFDKELCENICFNLNGSFFLYYCINPNRIEISDILSNHNIYLNAEVNKLNEYEILAVFWLNNPTILKNKRKNNSTNTSHSNNTSEFVVVTNCTVEIFEITFDSLTIQLLKKHFVNSQYCWYDANSLYIVLLSNKNHVLLPYLLNKNNAIKLPKIELNIAKADKIKENDIQIITLYDETYCIHKDHKNGRISFRCLSSTFYFDYVVDLFSNGVLDISTIDNLLIVFNNSNEKVYLFDILQKKNEIENNTKNYLTTLNNHTVNVNYLTNPKNFKSEINFNHITFKPFNVLIDNHSGNLYKIYIDYDVLMLQICQHYANLNTSVDVLLRRPNCKKRLTEMIFLSLENDIKIEDFLSIVNLININYRKLIESVAKKNIVTYSSTSGKSSTSAVTSGALVSGSGNSSSKLGYKNNKKITLLDNLLKSVEDKTLITEKDIVINVFHPYMIKRYNLDRKETLFNFSINFRQTEKNKKLEKKNSISRNKNKDEKYMRKYKIKKKEDEKSDFTFDSDKHSPDTDTEQRNEKKEKGEREEEEKKTETEEEKERKLTNVEKTQNISEMNSYDDYNMSNFNSSDFQSIPLFLIYVLEYMKSLLYLNILPNRILQTFIFDLCIFFRQDNCLRQLLQFYTISDSVEITKRLFHFWKLTEHKWAFQFCLDMSLRLKEYDMIIHLFLCSKQYLKVMSFLRKYNLVDYPISLVFQSIENDFDLSDKYTILNHVLQSLNCWINDFQKDPIKYPMPNLQNCQKWFELIEETE